MSSCLLLQEEGYLVGHTLAVLLGGVDQRLVQIHHQDQLLVAVEPLLVLSAQLLCLLSKPENTGNQIRFKALDYSVGAAPAPDPVNRIRRQQNS